jgi:signal transduction histidine kinase
MKMKFDVSLKLEIVGLVVVIVVFVVAVFSYFFISTYKSYFVQNLQAHTKRQAYRLADSVSSSVSLGRIDIIEHYINNTIRESDVIYVEVYGKNFNKLASCHILSKRLESFLASRKANENFNGIFKKQHSIEYTYEYKGKASAFEFITPIVSYKIGNENGEVIGFIRIISSLDTVYNKLAEIIRNILSLTGYVIVISTFLSFMAVKLFLEPINKIVEITKQISQGDLSTKVPIFKILELKILAISINVMSKHLKNILDILNNEKESLLTAKKSLEVKNRSIKDLMSKEQQLHMKLIKEERFYTIGRLAGSLAHEIKNPLAGIKNIVFFISNTENFKNKKSKEMFSMLTDNITKINNILIELVDYSEINNLNKSPNYIDELINKVIKTHNIPDNISLKTDLEHLSVLVDKDNFRKVINHLLINALDAMPFGGEIVISAHRVERILEVKIKDSGFGINDEIIKNIYEPLYTTKVKGVGLGLSIVKEIVELHNGTIDVSSKVGIGTEFTIKLFGIL